MNKLSSNRRHEASRCHELFATSNRRLDTPYSYSYLLPLSLWICLASFLSSLASSTRILASLFHSGTRLFSGSLASSSRYKVQTTKYQTTASYFTTWIILFSTGSYGFIILGCTWTRIILDYGLVACDSGLDLDPLLSSFTMGSRLFAPHQAFLPS